MRKSPRRDIKPWFRRLMHSSHSCLDNLPESETLFHTHIHIHIEHTHTHTYNTHAHTTHTHTHTQTHKYYHFSVPITNQVISVFWFTIDSCQENARKVDEIISVNKVSTKVSTFRAFSCRLWIRTLKKKDLGIYLQRNKSFFLNCTRLGIGTRFPDLLWLPHQPDHCRYLSRVAEGRTVVKKISKKKNNKLSTHPVPCPHGVKHPEATSVGSLKLLVWWPKVLV